jgi:V/A-type H+-transporting ATPase subunit I
MAITPVKKIHIVAHLSRRVELVTALQKLGVIEFFPSGPAPGSAGTGIELEALETRLGRVDQALHLLKPYFPAVTLAEKLYPPRPQYREAELQKIVSSFDLDGFLAACEGNSRELEDLQVSLARLEEEKRELSPWASLDAPPALLHSTSRVDILAVRFPLSRRQGLEKEIGAVGGLVEKALEDARHVYALLICHRSCGPRLHAAIKEHDVHLLKLPDLQSTPPERLLEIEKERRRLSERVGELREGYRSLVRDREELLVLRDLLANHVGRLRTDGLMSFTERTFSLEGWIPAARLPEVQRRLLDRFPLLSIDARDPGPLDKPPVILDNPAVVSPFGLVVDLYGMPRYGAIDPSSILAFFFALFFALCLSDAGYGLLLAAFTGVLLVRAPRPLPPGRERFFKLLFLCALATIVVGAAAGGWFGLAAPWRLFDPLEDLMLFFLLALGVGTAHLFAGLVLRMIRLVRAGDLLGAAADQGLWMVIILSLYGFAAGRAGYGPAWLPQLGGGLAVLSASGIVFFQGRSGDGEGEEGAPWFRHLPWLGMTVAVSGWLLGYGRPWTGLAALALAAWELVLVRGKIKGPLARVGLGLYSLYGITGYLSDILSYSRLVALGLGTGIVALVVNKMSAVALGMPVIGAFMAGAVLVVGHLFNIMINLLGAFVHSCRLQYVEFFTKFYESGGRAFRPFRIENRYIRMTETGSTFES